MRHRACGGADAPERAAGRAGGDARPWRPRAPCQRISAPRHARRRSLEAGDAVDELDRHELVLQAGAIEVRRRWVF